MSAVCNISQSRGLHVKAGSSAVLLLGLLVVVIANTAFASSFTNLLQSYSTLETTAGSGAGREDKVNYWQSKFEGCPATSAALSRPHYAMADRAGNIYIADKDSHSVLRVATDGTIHTHAGTHVGGFNGEGPVVATNLQLNFPNALWVRADGTVYVLDTDNGIVRRIATNGVAETFFRAKKSRGKLDGGRMLWVKDDESLAYFGNETKLKRWTPTNGVETIASGFTDLGTFCVEPDGDLIVADRGAGRVYRVSATGVKSVLQSSLAGPRGVWPAPTGGYFILLHDGAQLWHLDVDNTMHLLVNGTGGNAFTHAGDGKSFYAPNERRIGEGRSVSVDSAGNIILCESDYGFIRRIRVKNPAP